MKCPITKKTCHWYKTYKEELCVFCGVTVQNQSGSIVMPTLDEVKQSGVDQKSYERQERSAKKTRHTASPDAVTPIFE